MEEAVFEINYILFYLDACQEYQEDEIKDRLGMLLEAKRITSSQMKGYIKTFKDSDDDDFYDIVIDDFEKMFDSLSLTDRLESYLERQEMLDEVEDEEIEYKFKFSKKVISKFLNEAIQKKIITKKEKRVWQRIFIKEGPESFKESLIKFIANSDKCKKERSIKEDCMLDCVGFIQDTVQEAYEKKSVKKHLKKVWRIFESERPELVKILRLHSKGKTNESAQKRFLQWYMILDIIKELGNSGPFIPLRFVLGYYGIKYDDDNYQTYNSEYDKLYMEYFDMTCGTKYGVDYEDLDRKTRTRKYTPSYVYMRYWIFERIVISYQPTKRAFNSLGVSDNNIQLRATLGLFQILINKKNNKLLKSLRTGIGNTIEYCEELKQKIIKEQKERRKVFNL